MEDWETKVKTSQYQVSLGAVKCHIMGPDAQCKIKRFMQTGSMQVGVCRSRTSHSFLK